MGKLMVEDRIGVLLLWWESLGAIIGGRWQERAVRGVAPEPPMFDVWAWLL